MTRPPVTTHILDLAAGKPAGGINVRLYQGDDLLAEGWTNDDGRVESWNREYVIEAATYRLAFAVEPWFESEGRETFYEDVQISFRVADPSQHYHVPLLLSPFGYSTYRGS